MSVFSCGFGRDGALGLSEGDRADYVTEPTVIAGLKGKNIVSVSCGEQHNLAITDLGDVWSWGRGTEGQLGHGNCGSFATPLRIEALQHESIVRVACGHSHSLAVTDAGRLYAWGRLHRYPAPEDDLSSSSSSLDSSSSSLSLSSSSSSSSSSRLPLSEEEIKAREEAKKDLTQKQKNLIKLRTQRGAVGSKKDMGGLDAWSHLMKNEGGGDIAKESIRNYLANGLEKDEENLQLLKAFNDFEGYKQLRPKLIRGPLLEKRVKMVAAGYCFTLIVCDEPFDGQVYGFGFNEKGQLGLGHRFNIDQPQLLKTLVEKGQKIVSVSCGQEHSLALTSQGKVWSWGLGVFGQLGHGECSDSLFPQPIPFFMEHRITVKKIACGAHHSIALTDEDRVFSWGHGEYGQHGGSEESDHGSETKFGKDDFFATPRPLNLPSAADLDLHSLHPSAASSSDEPVEKVQWADVSCGNLHNCLISNRGKVYTWGWGASGCLGHGNRRFQLAPKMVASLQAQQVISVACAWKHTIFLQPSSLSTFAVDYAHLINNPSFADLAFEFPSPAKRIYGHQAIICARSQRLRQLVHMQERFCNITQKSSSDGLLVIEIKTIPYAVFLGLLQYLYTDQVKIAPHLISKLQAVSQTYRLDRLTSLCEQHLSIQSGRDFYVQIPESTFRNDLSQIVAERSFSDLSIHVCGDSDNLIHAHRSILVSRCQFFKTMFDSSFKEGKGNTINLMIPFPRSSIVSALEYLYTGDPGVVQPHNVADLLGIADCIMVEHLKQLCEVTIQEAIDGANCWWIYELADRYNAPRLRHAAETYIIQSESHLKRITGGDEFRDFLSSAPQKLLSHLESLCLQHNFSSSSRDLFSLSA